MKRQAKYKRWKETRKRYLFRMAELLAVPRYYKLSRLQTTNGMHLFSEIDVKFNQERFAFLAQADNPPSPLNEKVREWMRAKRESVLRSDSRRVNLARANLLWTSKIWDLELDCEYICRTCVIFGVLRVSATEVSFVSRPTSERTGDWNWTVDPSIRSSRKKEFTLKINLLERAFIRRVTFKYGAI